jgi:hypothetical protein
MGRFDMVSEEHIMAVSEHNEMEPINVKLTKAQIADIVSAELRRQSGPVDEHRERAVVLRALDVLDSLGLLVRDAR